MKRHGARQTSPFPRTALLCALAVVGCTGEVGSPPGPEAALVGAEPGVVVVDPPFAGVNVTGDAGTPAEAGAPF